MMELIQLQFQLQIEFMISNLLILQVNANYIKMDKEYYFVENI